MDGEEDVGGKTVSMDDSTIGVALDAPNTAISKRNGMATPSHHTCSAVLHTTWHLHTLETCESSP